MLKTVANMNAGQLARLLASFPAAAKVERTESTVAVHTPKGRKVLSAVSADGRTWHVMAVPGLVDAH